MKPAQITFAACCAALLVTAARAADPATDIGRNAALIYWQAFDQLASQMKDEAFAKAVNEHGTIAIDAKVRGYVKESAALTLLRFASGIEPCDWGIRAVAQEQGPYTLLPHLGKLRELARLGLLSARVNLADKKGDQAIGDLFAVYRVASHSQLADGDVVISHLVGIAIEATANQFVADHLAVFSDAELKSVHDRLLKLRPLPHVSLAILAEGKTFGGWMKREAAALNDPAKRRQFLALLSGEEQEAVRKAVGEPHAVVAMIDDMFAQYEKIADLMKLPPAKFGPAHKDFQEKIEASKNPLSKMLLPAFARVHGTYHRSLAQREMLRALLVWRMEGRAAFDKIADPYGDSAFSVRTIDDGIEVSSKLSTKEQPVLIKSKWKPKE